MEEYKFRAWDTVKEYMYYDVNIISIKSIDPEWSFGSGGLYIKADSKRFKLMQYTGLLVKGKETYKEDIVKWYGHEVRNGKQIRPIYTFVITPAIDVLFKLKNLIESNETVEIIGNKYDNPELLKE